jgi:microcystin-dependent protein
MSTPYIGEIRMFAGNFAPAGWMFCSGQLLSISEYETLFQLIGTTYGGDGQSTFALPDMQGRLPIHQGGGYVLAENGGVELVTLTANQIPSHTHTVKAASGAGHARSPEGAVPAGSGAAQAYSASGPIASMAAGAVGPAGAPGPQPHDNTQPSLCVNFIISMYGIFPSPS